jgi:glutamine cyclotransferase
MLKNYLKFALIVLGCIIYSCKDEKLEFTSNIEKIESNPHYFGETFVVEISDANLKINSINLKINDKKIQGKEVSLDSLIANYGTNYLSVLINYEDNKTQTYDYQFSVFSSIKETKKSFKILEELPHDGSIFTQGFEIENGMVYEGSGQEGESKVMKYALNSTKIISETKNSDDVFGEGITILRGKLYQLTWKNKKAFVYDASTLKLEKELSYPMELKEGWGICNDGKYLFVTGDSTAGSLYQLDENFKLLKILPIVGNNKIYFKANELEFANGKIYANIWEEDIIIEINPKTGQATNYYDFSEIVAKNKTSRESVLNGIAHISGNTFLITGKNWNKMYKVELIPFTN